MLLDSWGASSVFKARFFLQVLMILLMGGWMDLECKAVPPTGLTVKHFNIHVVPLSSIYYRHTPPRFKG